jgi:CRISPR type III-A-associated protein Csm2
MRKHAGEVVKVPPRPQETRPQGSGDIRNDVQQIVAGEDYELLVRRGAEWGRQLAEANLRMAQIRRVFGEVKRLQMRWEPQRLRMLRPRLSYVAARAGRGGALLRDILSSAIDTVFQVQGDGQQKRFRVMADLFEAILAHYTEVERRQGRREE